MYRFSPAWSARRRVVVSTADTVLVASRTKREQVKALIEQLTSPPAQFD
jgi:hypothetical protein